MIGHRKVVSYRSGGSAQTPGHEVFTHARITRQIAALLGGEEGGEHEPMSGETAPHLYFVPSDTLTRAHAAGQLGITCEDDLFGGVVPHPYVATKAITHPVLGTQAAAPEHWLHEFHCFVAGVVLPGYSAYTAADAKDCAAGLLDQGAVRLKRVCETGGRGQSVMLDANDAERQLAVIGDQDIERHGVVLELNLEAAKTLSVGRIRLGSLLASYYGVQHTTRDHNGQMVYGGSTLFIVRGEMEALLARNLAPDVRLAVDQARRFDAAADACFPDFYASRRNYDVAQGFDGRGRFHSGVLEQSWRLGGASTVEICALEAFETDPSLNALTGKCTEVYGACRIPKDARIYYQGDDPRVGRITKYVVVERG